MSLLEKFLQLLVSVQSIAVNSVGKSFLETLNVFCLNGNKDMGHFTVVFLNTLR